MPARPFLSTPVAGSESHGGGGGGGGGGIGTAAGPGKEPDQDVHSGNIVERVNAAANIGVEAVLVGKDKAASATTGGRIGEDGGSGGQSGTA